MDHSQAHSQAFEESNSLQSPKTFLIPVNDNNQWSPPLDPLCQPEQPQQTPKLGFWTNFINRCKKIFGCCCIYHE